MSHTEGSTSPTEDWQPEPSQAQSAFVLAWQRQRIAKLEGKIETLKSGHAVKERQTNYYLAERRSIRRIVALFDSIEDLVAENDRRYDDNNEDKDATLDQDRQQVGYSILTKTLPWFLKNASDMEHDDYMRMLKMLRQGADSAQGDDTLKLKVLVSNWVNRELKQNPPG